MFTGTEEIQYGDIYVLYSDSSKVRDQIHDVWRDQNITDWKTRSRSFIRISYFLDTSILLIGDKINWKNSWKGKWYEN